MTISRDEWLRALGEAGEPATDERDAVTIPEFMAMFGLQREAAARRLRRLEAAGKATRTRKRGQGSDGRTFWFVAFRLVS